MRVKYFVGNHGARVHATLISLDPNNCTREETSLTEELNEVVPACTRANHRSEGRPITVHVY